MTKNYMVYRLLLEEYACKWEAEYRIKTALTFELQRAKEDMIAMQERHASEVETLRNELVIARSRIENLTFQESSVPSIGKLANRGSESFQSPNRFGWLAAKVQSLSLRRSASDGIFSNSSEFSDNSKDNDSMQCQSTSWEVLSSAPGVVAFMCSMKDLRIQNATKKACEIWGSSKLYGQDLASLSSSADSTSLKRVLEKVPRKSEAKAVDLGCISMVVRSNKVADFALTAVPIPKTGGDSSTVIIIADKLKNNTEMAYKRHAA